MRFGHWLTIRIYRFCVIAKYSKCCQHSHLFATQIVVRWQSERHTHRTASMCCCRQLAIHRGSIVGLSRENHTNFSSIGSIDIIKRQAPQQYSSSHAARMLYVCSNIRRTSSDGMFRIRFLLLHKIHFSVFDKESAVCVCADTSDTHSAEFVCHSCGENISIANSAVLESTEIGTKRLRKAFIYYYFLFRVLHHTKAPRGISIQQLTHTHTYTRTMSRM